MPGPLLFLLVLFGSIVGVVGALVAVGFVFAGVASLFSRGDGPGAASVVLGSSPPPQRYGQQGGGCGSASCGGSTSEGGGCGGCGCGG